MKKTSLIVLVLTLLLVGCRNSNEQALTSIQDSVSSAIEESEEEEDGKYIDEISQYIQIQTYSAKDFKDKPITYISQVAVDRYMHSAGVVLEYENGQRVLVTEHGVFVEGESEKEYMEYIFKDYINMTTDNEHYYNYYEIQPDYKHIIIPSGDKLIVLFSTEMNLYSGEDFAFLFIVDIANQKVDSSQIFQNSYYAIDFLVQDEKVYFFGMGEDLKLFLKVFTKEGAEISNCVLNFDTTDKSVYDFVVLEDGQYETSYNTNSNDATKSYKKCKLVFTATGEVVSDKFIEDGFYDVMKYINENKDRVKEFNEKNKMIEFSFSAFGGEPDIEKNIAVIPKFATDNVNVYWVGMSVVVEDTQPFALYLQEAVGAEMDDLPYGTTFYALMPAEHQFYQTDKYIYLQFRSLGSLDYVGTYVVRYDIQKKAFTDNISIGEELDFFQIEPEMGHGLLLTSGSQGVYPEKHTLQVFDLEDLNNNKTYYLEFILPETDGYYNIIDDLKLNKDGNFTVYYTPYKYRASSNSDTEKEQQSYSLQLP